MVNIDLTGLGSWELVSWRVSNHLTNHLPAVILIAYTFGATRTFPPA